MTAPKAVSPSANAQKPAIAPPAPAPVATHPPTHDQQQHYKPTLNVQDALTYLEKVKQQFSQQPDVYNQFLDIMRDFKTSRYFFYLLI